LTAEQKRKLGPAVRRQFQIIEGTAQESTRPKQPFKRRNGNA
jgi:hypothetical protein